MSDESRQRGVYHPNATLTKEKVARIWAIHRKHREWGYRQVWRATGWDKRFLGAVERVLKQQTYRDLVPAEFQPKGFVVEVEVEGETCRVYHKRNPHRIVVIKDGIALFGEEHVNASPFHNLTVTECGKLLRCLVPTLKERLRSGRG